MPIPGTYGTKELSHNDCLTNFKSHKEDFLPQHGLPMGGTGYVFYCHLSGLEEDCQATYVVDSANNPHVCHVT